MKVAVYLTIAFQLEQFLYFNGTGYPAHDIGLLTTDIPLHHTICTDDDLGRTGDITDQGAVNTEIPVARNIPFQGCSTADKTCTAGWLADSAVSDLVFVIKH